MLRLMRIVRFITALGRKEHGGIALESALFFPLFATFMLAFVSCMHLFLAEMALQQATSETVKQIAQHMYALKIVKDSGLGEKVHAQLGKVTSGVDYVEDAVQEAAEYIPESMYEVLGLFDAAKEQKEKWIKEGAGFALKPLLIHHLSSGMIHSAQVRVTDVQLPWILDDNNAYVGLTVEYEVLIKLPYYTKSIPIQVQAYERAWIGGIS